MFFCSRWMNTIFHTFRKSFKIKVFKKFCIVQKCSCWLCVLMVLLIVLLWIFLQLWIFLLLCYQCHTLTRNISTNLNPIEFPWLLFPTTTKNLLIVFNACFSMKYIWHFLYFYLRKVEFSWTLFKTNSYK